MSRSFGQKDSDRLIAYLQDKLRDVTGDKTVTVRKVPEAEQYEDGPKLKARFSGKQNNLNQLGDPPRSLQSILEEVFPPSFQPYNVSAVSYTAQADDPSKPFDLSLFVPSFYIAVAQAQKNDPAAFATSQESLHQKG